MHIKREKTHGKEGNFKDEKYKHKGYKKSFASLLDDLALLSFTCVGKDSFSQKRV